MNDKNYDEFKVGNEVKVMGEGDDIFLIRGKFEQVAESQGREYFQMWFSLKHKEKGYMIEASCTSVFKIIVDYNEFLDEYNCLMFMENIFQNGKIKLEADRLMQETKYSSRRQHG